LAVKLYAHFIHCLKEKCGEGRDGKCNAGVFTHERTGPVRVSVPYPEDGKCLFPGYFPYSEEMEGNGAYETTEEVDEADKFAPDIPF